MSKATVSRFLNNKLNAMTAETAKRIQETIKRLNYRPNLLASGLKSKRTFTIGVVTSSIINSFNAKVYRGIEQECKSRGFSIFLCNSDNDIKKQDENIEQLLSQQVDGIVLLQSASGAGSSRSVEHTLKKGTPVVLISRQIPGIKASIVRSAGYEGARSAAKYLIELGHKILGIVSLPISCNSARRERVEGFRAALYEHGLDIDSKYLRIINDDDYSSETPYDEQVKKEIEELLSLDRRPTALFASTNTATIKTIAALRQLNVKVPCELSIIGFDDSEWASLLRPSLTVVQQPAIEMGIEATKMLMDDVANREKRGREPRTVILPTQLIVRESCSRPCFSRVFKF